METSIASGDSSSNTKVCEIGEECKDSGVLSGNTATLALPDVNLVCVEYPAVVNNVDRMLDSIEREKGVSKVIVLCLKVIVSLVRLNYNCSIWCSLKPLWC